LFSRFTSIAVSEAGGFQSFLLYSYKCSGQGLISNPIIPKPAVFIYLFTQIEFWTFEKL